jgi:hypothetical protein
LIRIFAERSEQRGFILDQVVQGVATSLATVKSGKKGKYIVGDGTAVFTVSALVVALIQSGIRTNGDELERWFSDESGGNVNNGTKKRLDSVSTLANYFITQIITKIDVSVEGKRKRSSTGSGVDASYRVFIDVFSMDLISMLNMPEFPCVESISIVFSLKMVFLIYILIYCRMRFLRIKSMMRRSRIKRSSGCLVFAVESRKDVRFKTLNLLEILTL